MYHLLKFTLQTVYVRKILSQMDPANVLNLIYDICINTYYVYTVKRNFLLLANSMSDYLQQHVQTVIIHPQAKMVKCKK
jgi:hypothetical protein